MTTKFRFWGAVVAACFIVTIGGCGQSEGGSTAPAQATKAPPVITVHPKNTDTQLGETATFKVEATGDGIEYQWEKDGAPIEGATSDTYIIPAVSVADAKTVVSVSVKNNAGKVHSEPASVLVHKVMPSQPPSAYLASKQVQVAELLPFETVGKLAVSVVDGPEMMVKLGDDNILRYLAPVEQYKDSVTTLVLQDVDSGLRYFVPLPWKSRIGEPISIFSGDTGSDKLSLILSVDGEILNGGVPDGASSIMYTLTAKNRISLDYSQITMSGDADPIFVTDWFDVAEDAGTLTLKKEYLPQFYQILKGSGTATVRFSLGSVDGVSTYGFDSNLRYMPAALTVKMVDSKGAPDLTTAGKDFVVVGHQSGYSALLKANELGELSIKNIPIDDYAVDEVLLEPGTPSFGSAPFGKNAKNGRLVLVTSQLPEGSVSNTFSDDTGVVVSGQDQIKSGITQEQSDEPIVTQSDSSYYTLVTAGAADKENVVKFRHIFEKPVDELSVEVVVKSNEAFRPKDIADPTPRNDRWRFSVEVPGAEAMAGSGNVLETHATSTTKTFKQCIKIPATKEPFVIVSGIIAATNAVNSTYSTSVALTIKSYCSLIISEFAGRSMPEDPNGFRMITQANTSGNVQGQYLSLPIQKQLPLNFGIPSSIMFLPANAVPKEVELFIQSPAGKVSLGTKYLADKGVEVRPGYIKFPKLILDVAAHEPAPHKVQLLAQLTAEVEGKMQTSKPVPIVIDASYSDFTPLYAAESMRGYTLSGRYGGAHDEPGGDGWGTYAMLDWLLKTPYRYNDVSAANIAQNTKNKKSVLGHLGHSDGSQVDVRYADGNGGFTDLLISSEKAELLLELAEAAKKEVDEKSTNSPSLDKLKKWISENRAAINAEAASTNTRAIFIGNSFIYDLLVSGRFPYTKIAVPGVGKWQDQSSKISFAEGHLSHWHISRK